MEEQGATVVRGVWDCRPIEAVAAHAVQQTGCFAAAKTHSREIDGGIRRSDFVVEVPPVVPSTVYIHWPIILTIRRETGESVRGGHVETGGAGIIDGLDNGIIVETFYCIVC